MIGSRFRIGLLLCTTLLVFTAGSSNAGAQETYDVVILNGRVMDPRSGFDGVRNVGVKDGRIAKITEDAINGAETIDATDHAVVPGFVDTHIHGQSAFSYKIFLRDD